MIRTGVVGMRRGLRSVRGRFSMTTIRAMTARAAARTRAVTVNCVVNIAGSGFGQALTGKRQGGIDRSCLYHYGPASERGTWTSSPGAIYLVIVMKIRNSLKSLLKRHRDNRLVRRKGRIYIINKT